MKLTHVRLLVADFSGCFRFYHDTLGFVATWGDENSGYADFKVSESVALAIFDRLEMAQTVGAAHLPSTAQAQDRAALIFEADDLDILIGELQNRGANIVSPPKDFPGWGIRAAHLRDPDGNLIELNKPLAVEEWTDDLRREAQQNEQ